MILQRERQAIKAAIKVQRAGSTPEIRLSAAVSVLLDMGGLYVKFAQLLLLNQVFSKAVAPELRREVFDRVRLQKQDDHYLAEPEVAILAEHGISMDPTPRYAGSFAVVFDAKTQNGEKLIIKVIRPELRRELKRDLRLIGIISKSVSIFKPDVQAAIRNAYHTFKGSVLRETDYRAEAAFAERMRRRYQGDPILVIPKTWRDISTRHFIVQEKLEGVWLSELLGQNLKGKSALDYVRSQIGSDLEYQLHYLGFRSLYDSLSGKTVHGDPHPGNVVLMANNKVGLIDFGIVAKPVNNRLALLEYIKEQIRGREGDIDLPRLMLSIVRFHASNLYRALESLSAYYKKPLLDNLYKFLQIEVGKSQTEVDESMVPNGQYSDMLNNSINKGNRFGLLPKVDTPVTQKAFITLWRTNDELGYQDITFKVFRDVVRSIEQDNDVALWRKDMMSTGQAMEVVSEWLNLVAQKDPELFGGLARILNPAAPTKAEQPST